MEACAIDSVHSHCSNCFSISDCDYSRRCPISMCPNECYFRMHECKIDDHVINICPNSKISCPSSSYGCPLRILRRNLTGHLQVCPASIVHCTVERNRKLIDKDAAKKIKDPKQGAPIMDNLDCSALDLCLALDDQTMMNDSYKISKDILRHKTNSLSKYHPILPLIMDEKCSEVTHKSMNLRDTDSFSSEEDSDDYEYAIKLPAVSSECVKCRLDPGSQHLHTLGAIRAETGRKPLIRKKSVEKTVYTNPEHNLLVDICLDFLSQSYPKRRDHYTISCDFVIKRGEFADHYENYHADFICNLNDWMIIRCPMSTQGCQFYHRRFRPLIPQNSSILHSNRNFGIYMDDETVGENNAISTMTVQYDSFDWSTKLPADLWIQICKLLSSQSLNTLSKVCSKLRSVCKLILPYKGMVQMKWQKSDNKKWIQKSKYWSFSKHFEKIDRWVFDDMGPYCSHIKQCKFYDPVIYSQPIPVLRTMTYDDLNNR